ncbi:hypothetical protein [Myceligenerans crystallogenes]|uniref:Uncharacterized protein n=1 Tax=Myceligenerans crystallogenes TaxID=316335 RepID=A0ABP4ZLY3_9MICO
MISPDNFAVIAVVVIAIVLIGVAIGVTALVSAVSRKIRKD